MLGHYSNSHCCRLKYQPHHDGCFTVRPPQAPWRYCEIYTSVERRLMRPLSIRWMAGKFTWNFCGMIRKGNRRTLTLTVCGQQLFKVIKLRNKHSNIFEKFLRWESEIAVALCATLTELQADPSGHAVYGVGLLPHACWDCRFEFRRWHGGLPLMRVVCCQV